MNKLKGIVSALITPFDSADRVNVPVLKRLVRYALDNRVSGFYVCGSTGEGLLMSEDERKLVVDTICSEVNGAAGVVVNISHMEIAVVKRLASHAATAGADAVSSLPPLFFPVNEQEMTAYFQTLLDECELPLTIYNIPMLSNIKLTEAMVGKLASHPRMLGIKHSSEDTVLQSRFKKLADGRLLVWAARDAYYLSSLAMGADGAIGSSYALTGEVFAKITEVFQRGDVVSARRLQERVNEVHARLQKHGPFNSYKRCFELLGIPAGQCRSPYLPLGSELDPYFRQTLELLAVVQKEAAAH